MHECSGECVPWTGTNKCHCTKCGETFTVVANFDKHRKNGQCLKPTRVGLVLNAHGIWKSKDEVDYDERFKR